MLHYKNARFYCGDASFSLPDNCLVDGFNEYAGSHDGLLISSPDGDFCVDISFDAADDTAEAFLSTMAKAQELGIAPQPFTHDRLSGWVLCQDRAEETGSILAFDVNPDTPDDDTPTILELIVWSKKNIPWNAILHNPMFQSLLDGIRWT